MVPAFIGHEAIDMPRPKTCTSVHDAASATRTHHLRAGAIAAPRTIAGRQSSPRRREGLQHELRVLPVRVDARGPTVNRAIAGLARTLAHPGSRGRAPEPRGRTKRADRSTDGGRT